MSNGYLLYVFCALISGTPILRVSRSWSTNGDMASWIRLALHWLTTPSLRRYSEFHVTNLYVWSVWCTVECMECEGADCMTQMESISSLKLQHNIPSLILWWVNICRHLASLASFALRILFMRSTLWVLTSRKPITFCGHSSWAAHWVVSRRRETTTLNLAMPETGRISWITSFVRWISFVWKGFCSFLRRVSSQTHDRVFQCTMMWSKVEKWGLDYIF